MHKNRFLQERLSAQEEHTIDGTNEGIEAVKNEEMLGTVYNDKEGQAREMLNLTFVIATDGDKSDIPLIDEKYVRTPYHKLTLENIEEYK